MSLIKRLLAPGAVFAVAMGLLSSRAAAQTPACADCHDEAKVFARTPHAHVSPPGQAGAEKAPAGDAVCATCHGDGTKHAEAGGDKSLIRGLHGADGAAVCVTCHTETAARRSFKNGMHASTATVNCLSCHSLHASVAPGRNLLARAPVALCASCHPGQASSLANKPFAHRMGRGAMDCASCHDPHGQDAARSLQRTFTGELACLSCHAEKRGPFVFEHVGSIAGDCMSCHEPHGSANARMLKRARVDRLCLECHSPMSAKTLGSQPPSFHNISLPRYQNCTTCHVAIHGSNLSPQFLK